MPGRLRRRWSASATALALAVLLLGTAACDSPSDGATNPIGGAQVDSSDTRAHRLGDLIERSDTLTVFAKALRQAGLQQELQRGGPYTVFAPTDRAISREMPGLDSLLVPDSLARAQPQQQPAPEAGNPQRDSLRTMMRFHLVRGRITAANVPDSLRVSTLVNRSLMLRRSGSGAPPALRVHVRDQPPARIARTIPAQNGVLHVLDAPLRLPAPDTTMQDTLGTEPDGGQAPSSQN